MKSKTFKIVAVLVLFAIVGAAIGLYGNWNSHSGGGNRQLYTCGMHPQVIRDKPGNCPICGMTLTPILRKSAGITNAAAERKIKFYKSSMTPGETSLTPGKDSMGMDMVPVFEDAATTTAGDTTIAIDSVTIQKMGIRTGLVTRGSLKRRIRTVSVIDFDETSLADVTTKFKGWVEKLYVDSTGRQVHKGEPLFEIYSPEVFSAQTEYLVVLNQLTNSAHGVPAETLEALKSSALTKLKFYDIPDDQIAEIEKTRRVGRTFQINAPRDGIVVEKMVVQGQMVDSGMKLYRLADMAIVWVQAQVYEEDLPFVHLGQDATVSLSYLPDRKFRGRVTYVYPTVDDKTRTGKVRLEFHNPGYFLKPGMFATLELESELDPAAVLVPDSAVLRSGQRNTVFVALDGGRFEPRTVTLGARSMDDMYQVLSGVKEGERVVVSGQFMLDSESQLREAINKMTKPATPEGADSSQMQPAATAAEKTPAPPAPDFNGKPLVYICPMPEHVAIQYDHPGKCAICGMTLIPVAQETLAKIPPGGAVDYYTCPMTDACPVPGHGAVKYDQPGKCPICGMTLVPILKPAPAGN